jgi:hypothetical protein
MAETIGVMPLSIRAGETIWIAAANAKSAGDILIDGYTPAGGYTLAYQFAGATPISVAAVANGANTGWTLELTPAQTLTWKAGTIRFAGYVTQTAGGRVFAVDSGTIAVEPSPLATSAWTAVVTKCDAAILAYAENPNGSFSVDGLSVSYRSLSQLTDLRSYAKTMADQETGNRPLRIIRARFT